MDAIIFFITLVLIVISLVACTNALFFPRLQRYPDSQSDQPLLSVLIPARDEAELIGETIGYWLRQRHTNFEVVLLDDHSSDDTYDAATLAAKGDARFHFIRGKEFPEGWKGKNWACHQLSQTAKGDLLLFTDADVHWEPEALTALSKMFAQSKADLLTIWPTQRTQTWAERLVVPLMAFTVMGYLPIHAVHHLPWAIFSAAMGQCLAIRRNAYIKIGGHVAFREALLEDMAFAKAIKRKGLRLRAADGAGLITTRMYKSWNEVRDGFSKNIIGGHGDNLFLLALSTLFHWMLFLFPWWWLFFDVREGAILCALGILIRALTAATTRQRVYDALFMPISVILMTLIAIRAVQWHFSSGPRWKGRTYGR